MTNETETQTNIGKADIAPGKSQTGRSGKLQMQDKERSSLEKAHQQNSGTKPMQSNSLKKLFEKELEVVYHSEKQLIKILPEILGLVSHPNLQKEFSHHLKQAGIQKERLEHIFHRLRLDKKGGKSLSMEMLLENAKKEMSELESGAVRDSLALIELQKAVHFEISLYGSLIDMAEVLGYHKIADFLDKSLAEEEDTDRQHSFIARNLYNQASQQVGKEPYRH